MSLIQGGTLGIFGDLLMSVPSQFAQRGSMAEPSTEDCRDYLRTGRCKYGASCKYNHPSNVQSGGGMKAPLDPTEPMFPIRPNEPVCQYYMKHGTCKFGQACKFNHPPQPPLQAVVNGRGTVMMSLGRSSSDVPHQLVVNPLGTDPSGSMMLQFLPQRPEEPDCIYFLKNGRCKYGATCRYHHPINAQQRRQGTSRLSSGQDQYRVQNVQFVSQLIPAYSAGQVGDGFLEGGAFSQGYQQVPVVANNDGSTSYAIPVTDQGSSASSLASSYDTAGSNLDHMAAHGDSAAALWSRARRNGSGGSLNAYSADSAGQPRAKHASVLHNSASDGNIARRNRSTSYGSASEASYYDAASTLSRNTSVGSWRNESSSTMEHGRRIPPNYSSSRSDVGISSTGSHELSNGPLPPPHMTRSPGGRRRSPRRTQRNGEGDEGFTMMTSALLNMLDTPEEVGASFDEDDPRLYYAQYPPHDEIDPAVFDRLSLNSSRPMADPRVDATTPPWSPSRRGTGDGRAGQDDALKVMQHHHANGASSHTHHGNDVGLYLP